jgi:beta-N-acetylhexosaminidase
MSAQNDAAIRSLVNGVLWPGFLGTTAPDWLRRELEAGLAGVVYFGQNLDPADAAQPARLSAELRGIRPDVVIGIDEEGGNVTRLEAATGSTLLGPAQLGRIDDVGITRRVSRMLGDRVRDAGINVTIAPDADVNTDPRNPVIGVRSFGDDGDRVAAHVTAAVEGIQSAGVAACAKHFPGHGDTHQDSHLALPALELAWAEVQAHHLPPFQAAIVAGVKAVMTAHIVVPAFGERPATLNRSVLRLLRDTGFDGAIITDALDMAAVRSTVGSGAGAVLALLAGADLLCIGNPSNLGPKAGSSTDQDDFYEVQRALFAAIDDGTLAPATLQRAGERVRELAVTPRADAATEPLDADRLGDLAVDAASVHGSFPALPAARTVVDLRARPTIAVAADTDYLAATIARGGAVRRMDPATATGSDLLAAGASPIVVLTDRAGVAGDQRSLIADLAAAQADAVVVNTGVPARDALPLPLIETRAASLLAARAADRLLAEGNG